MIYAILKKTNVKDRIFKNLLSGPARGKRAISQRKFNKKFIVSESDIEGFSLITIAHPSSDHHHILFLHGGAYFAEATAAHRKLIEKMVAKHHFKVSFIAYPLAPEHEASYTLEIVEKAYLQVQRSYPEDTISLFGDSAGGGLALASLQRLKDRQDGTATSSGHSSEATDASRLPQKTVLFSPWLDATLANPEIAKYKDLDVLLQFEGLKECGRMYAGKLGPESPLASPIKGDLNDLGNILVFVSDHEILYPDCLLLEQKAGEASGTSVKLRTAHKMVHDWLILPVREARKAIIEIAEFFRS